MSNGSRTRPTEDDAGKDVLDAGGERVGLVAAVEGGTVHVETDPGITDEIKAALGWTDTEDTRAVDEAEIERITDDAVHLGSSQASSDAGTASTTEAGAGAGADEEGLTDAGTGSEPPEGGPEADSTPGGTGTDVGTDPTTGTETDAGEAPEIGSEDDLSGDVDDVTTPRTTEGGGSEEDSTEVSEVPMDDTGDVTTARTTESGGSDEMTETGVDESVDDQATEEMGVPGEDAGERSPDVEEPGSGSGDVQDPATDEPRDAEDARELTDELDEDSPAPTDDPEEEPSVGEAATRDVEEEDAELGADDEREEGR